MSRDFRRALEILLAASVLAWAGNFFRPHPWKWTAWKSGSGVREEWKISPEEVKQRFLDGSAAFVDARTPPEFAAGHVPGAVNVPPEDCVGAWARAQARLPAAPVLIFYCRSAECDAAERVLRCVSQAGDAAGPFTLRLFQPGWEALRQLSEFFQRGE